MAQPDFVLPGAAPRLGRFLLGRELGRGATGVVYAATDTRQGQAVALKVLTLPPSHTPASSHDLAERFAREGRTVSQLSHPGIVALTETGQAEDGRQYLVMERLEGETLRARLQRGGPLLASEALPLLTQIADALQYAHGRGVIHQDVKPDNIFLCADGTAKLMDFGVARVYTEDRLAHAGMVVGSPAYMSPEQICGEALDGRTDVYSLAVTLAEALRGRRPFDGADIPSVMHQILHKPPQLDGIGSRPLRRALEHALAKNPAARTPSAGALAGALRQATPPFASVPIGDEAATLTTLVMPRSALLPPGSAHEVGWVVAAASAALAVVCFIVLPLALHHTAPPATSALHGTYPRLAAVGQAPRMGQAPVTAEELGEVSITERAVSPPHPKPARVNAPAHANTAVLQALRDETVMPDDFPPPLPEVRRLPPQKHSARPTPMTSTHSATPESVSPSPAPSDTDSPETVPPDAVLYGMGNPDRLQAPHLISHTDPIYPPSSHGAAGTARLIVSVNQDGGVSDARVVQSSGDSGLDDAAIATVLHWEYAPATHDGRPVSANIAETVTFGPH